MTDAPPPPVTQAPVTRAPVIRVRDLRFRYPARNRDAISLPAFDVTDPGLVAITGPSGAGKSTLIELLAGTLSERYTGSVQVLGKEWSELRGDRARQMHLRRIGLIPQDLGLLPNQTPRQMLVRALLDAGIARDDCDGRIDTALARMDVDTCADRRIAELSGGQKQRVAIARALARNVDLILADEPTANLNSQLADETIAELRRIGRTVPVVIVTHDLRIAGLCDRHVALVTPGAATPAPAAAPAAAPVAAAAAPAVVARPLTWQVPMTPLPAARPSVASSRPAFTPAAATRVTAAAATRSSVVASRTTRLPEPLVRATPVPPAAPERGSLASFGDRATGRERRNLIAAGAGALCGLVAIGVAIGAGVLGGSGPTRIRTTAAVTAAAPASTPTPVASPTPTPAPSPTPAPAAVAAAAPTPAPVAVVRRPVVKATPKVTASPTPAAVVATPTPAPSPTTPVIPQAAQTPASPIQSWMQVFGQFFGAPAPSPTPTPGG